MILNASKFHLQVTTTRSVSATAAVAIMAVYYSGTDERHKNGGGKKKKVGKLCELGTRCGREKGVAGIKKCRYAPPGLGL